MDEGERKKYPSLPPNYVSLAELKERWLQKQEESKKGREELEKREENQKLAGTQKQENVKDEIKAKNYRDGENRKEVRTSSLGYGLPRRWGRDEKKMGVVRGIVKEHEVKTGGSSGDGSMSGMSHEKKKKKKYRQKKRNRGAAGENGGRATKRAVIENDKEKEIPGNRDGCNDARSNGKLEKNDSGGTGIISTNEMVEIRCGLSGESTVKKGFSGDLQGTEGKVRLCTTEGLVENGGMINIRGFSRKYLNRKEIPGGFSRNGNNVKTEYKIKEKNVELGDLKGNEEFSSEKKERERNEFQKWLPEKQNGNRRGFGDGFLRDENNERTQFKMKEKNVEIDESNGREELAQERKETEREDFRSKGKNIIEDLGVEAEDRNVSWVTSKKVADEVSVGENERKNAKVGVRTAFRRNENSLDKIGRKFGNLTLNGNVARRAGSDDGYGRRYQNSGSFGNRWGMDGGGRRKYGNYGSFSNRQKVNQEHIGMEWVEKQKISDANAGTIHS